MRLEMLLDYLAEQTGQLNPDGELDLFTAGAIAKLFHIQRNTVSHYLNQALQQNAVIKINTRPAYFFHRAVFEKTFYLVNKNIFNSLSELEECKKGERSEELALEDETIKRDVFHNLIGADGSLYHVLEQVRMAALYPPNGLPLILNGPTGVGKSEIARLMHRFCIAEGILKADAPFVVLNCAQYANNQELLSANLFGYVKGAFTGADRTTPGLLEAANEGVLFLDEVHRLSPEGQEKLFVFMDSGNFRRLGESHENHTSKVRLVFATTEALNETLIDTFRRRIPITVELPSMDERGMEEKQELITFFLRKEAQTLQRTIHLPGKVLYLLTHSLYRGSIGELKNVIKYLCARSYAQDTSGEILELWGSNLPENLLSENTALMEGEESGQNGIILSPDTDLEEEMHRETTGLSMIYEMTNEVLGQFKRYRERQISRGVFEKKICEAYRLLIDGLIFKAGTPEDNELLRVLSADIRNSFRQTERSLNEKFDYSNLHAMASYFYYKGNRSIKWTDSKKEQMQELQHYLLKYHSKAYARGMKMISELKKQKRMLISTEDELFFELFCMDMETEKICNVKGIIIAHGYATAKSIANVADRMCGEHIVDCIDMPWDTSTLEVTEQLIRYVRENDISQGMIIMVDMGSLEYIYEKIKKYVTGPVAVINNVSTAIAVKVGSMALENMHVEEIVENVRRDNETNFEVFYPSTNNQRAIVVTCFTGIGTAVRLQKMMKNSIPPELDIEVIAYDYSALKKNGQNDALFYRYKVIGMIGTLDPQIDGINYISIESLISGNGREKMGEMFHGIADESEIAAINEYFVRNFSLQNVMGQLTILDVSGVMNVITQFFQMLEEECGKVIPNDKRLSLYIHISCMIERLIRGDVSVGHENIEKFKQGQVKNIKILENCLSVIKSTYSVNIPISEIGMIYNILSATTESSVNFFEDKDEIVI